MQTNPSKLRAKDGVLRCPICGCSCLHRIRRAGFAQRTFLALFGYYPWECAQCKERFLIKKRYGHIGSHHPASLD
jgi:hypothetical protein